MPSKLHIFRCRVGQQQQHGCDGRSAKCVVFKTEWSHTGQPNKQVLVVAGTAWCDAVLLLLLKLKGKYSDFNGAYLIFLLTRFSFTTPGQLLILQPSRSSWASVSDDLIYSRLTPILPLLVHVLPPSLQPPNENKMTTLPDSAGVTHTERQTRILLLYCIWVLLLNKGYYTWSCYVSPSL